MLIIPLEPVVEDPPPVVVASTPLMKISTALLETVHRHAIWVQVLSGTELAADVALLRLPLAVT